MKILILNTFFTLFIFLNTLIGNDKKQISFLTSVGSTIGEARARAHNTAYMSGMKIIERKTVKSGDLWITTVKITPRH
jgi:hypothetical protein